MTKNEVLALNRSHPVLRPRGRHTNLLQVQLVVLLDGLLQQVKVRQGETVKTILVFQILAAIGLYLQTQVPRFPKEGPMRRPYGGGRNGLCCGGLVVAARQGRLPHDAGGFADNRTDGMAVEANVLPNDRGCRHGDGVMTRAISLSLSSG